MKPISLKQLVQIAPLNNKTKQKTLNALSGLNESQKFEIARHCWKSISLSYQVLVKDKFDKMLDEMARGQAVYEKQDFQNAENEIFNKLLLKIDTVQSAEEAEAIKQQLKNPDSPPPTTS
jgi:hypothetical protein